MKKSLTHSELCALCCSHAVSCGAVFVSTEKGGSEKPDVFALFRDGLSVVYECKASRADFKSDANKHFRQNPADGMGCERIYVVNEGVCRPWEIPSGWQLAYAEDLDTLNFVVPCVPVGRKDFPRLHRFRSNDSAALALVAYEIAEGHPLLPDVFPVKTKTVEVPKACLEKMKKEGRCMVCRNSCQKGILESFSCPDFFPDYKKILG